MEYSVQSGNARGDERVAFSALVELRREGGDEALSADGVDISQGGMALRAAFLPDLGARLACSFRFSPDGELVRGLGEVVWAVWEGYREGSFGLRFVELDTKSAKAVRGFVAPSGDRGGPERSAGPVNLAIEGLSVPIEADVRLCERDRVVLEQELTFLRLGRSVEVDLPGQGKRRGRIGSIALRQSPLDVPTLVFGVLIDEADQASQVSPVGSAARAARPPAWGRGADQTQPDVVLFDDVELDNPFDAPRTPGRVAHPEPPPRAMRNDVTRLHDDMLGDDEVESTLTMSATAPGVEPSDAEPAQLAASGLSGLVGAGIEELARGIRRLILFSKALGQRLWQGEQSPFARASEQLVRFRRLAALPSQALGKWRKKQRKRRTTSAPPRVQRTTGAVRGGSRVGAAAPRNRRLYAAALGVVGMGLGVYALAPLSGASRIASKARHEVEIVPAQVEDESEQVFEAVTETIEEDAREAKEVAPAAPTPKPEAQTAAPSKVHEVEAAKVEATEVEEPPAFGDAEVPKGRTFVLRMDGPVGAVKGEPRDDGFTVRVPGRLALDRASPIAMSHGAVARAMILNRGDHAELTVDFLPGMQPKYKVRGVDRTIEVTLERP